MPRPVHTDHKETHDETDELRYQVYHGDEESRFVQVLSMDSGDFDLNDKECDCDCEHSIAEQDESFHLKVLVHWSFFAHRAIFPSGVLEDEEFDSRDDFPDRSDIDELQK
jgi:hypothetical protein